VDGLPVVAERDVILDLNYEWTKSNHIATVLHELGHVIGLGHPNEHGQDVNSIMNNPFYHFTIQPDDIEGVIAIYGAEEQAGPPVGALEIPSAGISEVPVVSGIGMVSGWVCDAENIVVEIQGQRFTAIYGSDRADTQSVCGDSDNGFGLVINWNLIGQGTHQIVAYADGVEFARTWFAVGSFGVEFFTGRDRETWYIPNFPRQGERAIIMWAEEQQSFVVLRVDKEE
jgi:hypothetical protein